MTFKQGEIVTFPDTNQPMQVVLDSTDDYTHCMIIHGHKKHLFIIPSEELNYATTH